MKFAGKALGAPRARSYLIAAVGAIAFLAMWASLARAADPAAYGEVAPRWGGLNASGAAQIGQPVGFAADPVDDSVYIVDLQNRDVATGEATFRLRKFAGMTGELQGTGTFTATNAIVTAPPSVASVAVDHAAGHVYISLVAQNVAKSIFAFQQIQVFGTDVGGGGTLTAPADVADGTLLDSAPRLRVNAVIAVDPTNHDVVVSGTHPTLAVPAVYRFRGTAGDGKLPGDDDGTWVGPTGTAAIVGVTVAANGEVYLATKPGGTWYNLRVRRLSADLSTETPFMPTASQGAAQGIIAGDPGSVNLTAGTFGARALGAPLAFTSDGSLLAMTVGMWPIFSPDAIIDPLQPGSAQTTLGVRRITPSGEDAGIVGGGAATGACAISEIAGTTGTPVGGYGVQPGANGTFFSPSWLPDNTVEMTVFGPGGNGCSVPTPVFALRANGEAVPADGSVPTGAETTVDLSGSDFKTGSLMELDWDLDGDTTNGPKGDGFEIVDRRPLPAVDPDSPAPPMTQTVTFDTSGEHPVRARILTTAGTTEATTVVRVADLAIAPTAEFFGPQVATAGQAVPFDATRSRALPEGSAATLRYEWDFGDPSGTFTEGSATPTHTYANPGTYTVQVRVTDTSNGESTLSLTRPIVIRAAARREERREDPPIQDPPRQDPPIQQPPIQQPPAQTAADTTAPSIALKALGTAIRSNGALALQLGCPRGESSCSGSVEVRTASAVAASAAARRGAKRAPKRRVLVLGRASFNAAGGKNATVTIKLSAAGRRLLARSKHLKVVVTVAARDAAGNAKTISKTLTLTVARAAPRRGGRKK